MVINFVSETIQELENEVSLDCYEWQASMSTLHIDVPYPSLSIGATHVMALRPWLTKSSPCTRH